MKNYTLLLTVVSLFVLSGCSNVRYVQAREDCHRHLIAFIPWDHCGEKGEPLPQVKMIGDPRVAYESGVAKAAEKDPVIPTPVEADDGLAEDAGITVSQE